MPIRHFFLKVRRKIIKKYIKLTHPKSERNKAHYWPDITTSPDHVFYKTRQMGSTRLTDLAKQIDQLSDHNSVINIVGSGPSVNDLDFQKLTEHANIFLNGSISLAIKHELPVAGHVILDPYFVFSRIDLLQNNLPRHNLILSLGAMCAIAERDITILERHDVFVFNEVILSADRLFSDDIDSYLVDGGSVISIAMQVAVNTSVQEVRLLGLDIGNAAQPRFYETKDNVQRNCLLSDFESKIVPFMQASASVYRKKGISLVNCSPISKLSYEIIPYWGGYQYEPDIIHY